MNTQNTPTPAKIRQEFPPTMAAFFSWIDRHPRTAAALLWLQAAAILYAVITYNFTTL